MSTVDEAVEAGARAMSHHWRDMHTNESLGRQRQLAVHATRAMWPVLSAGLRELHTRWDQGGGWVVCMHCNANTSPTRKKQWPCETITELDRIDRELGIEADHQPGTERAAPCPDHRPVQHRDARPPWCNSCGLTEGGEVPTGPLDRGNRS